MADKTELLAENLVLKQTLRRVEGEAANALKQLREDIDKLTDNALGRAFRAVCAERDEALKQESRLKEVLDEIAKDFGVTLDYENL